MSWQQKSLSVQALIIYLSAVIFAILFYPLFNRIYFTVVQSSNIPGLFGWGDWWVFSLFQGALFAWPFFIALFTISLARKKVWLVWLIGAAPLFLIFYLGEAKQSWWFLIFTICGLTLGWLIKFIYLKIKK